MSEGQQRQSGASGGSRCCAVVVGKWQRWGSKAFKKWLMCYMIGPFLGVAVGSASCPVCQ